MRPFVWLALASTGLVILYCIWHVLAGTAGAIGYVLGLAA